MFHRVDDLARLGGPRFLRLVQQLPRYDGAVRGALVQAYQQDAPASPIGEQPQQVNDLRALEALTNQSGFMGFEYAGGD